MEGKRKYRKKERFLHFYFLLSVFVVGFSITTVAQVPTDVLSESFPDSIKDGSRKKMVLQITELGFGGTAIKVTSFNGQLAIMNGGRGYATINDRFTVGGGGYGVGNNIDIPSDDPTVYNFFKMGYGGLELGYFLLKGKRANVSTTILVGLGAAFTESVPKEKTESGFKVFPVYEPAINAELSLNRLMKLNAGITYRFVSGTNVPYMTNTQMCGPSVYIALLFGTCTCDL